MAFFVEHYHEMNWNFMVLSKKSELGTVEHYHEMNWNFGVE